jgi:hypothetical protein
MKTLKQVLAFKIKIEKICLRRTLRDIAGHKRLLRFYRANIKKMEKELKKL